MKFSVLPLLGVLSISLAHAQGLASPPPSCASLGFDGNWKDQNGFVYEIAQKDCVLELVDTQNGDLVYFVPLDGTPGTLPYAFYDIRSDRHEDFVHDVTYTVAGDANKGATVSFSASATLPKISSAQFSLSAEITINTIAVPNPALNPPTYNVWGWFSDTTSVSNEGYCNYGYIKSNKQCVFDYTTVCGYLTHSNSNYIGKNGVCVPSPKYLASLPQTVNALKLSIQNIQVKAKDVTSTTQAILAKVVNFAVKVAGLGETKITLLRQ